MIKLIRNLILLALAIGAFQIIYHQSDSDIAKERATELNEVEEVKVAFLWPFTLKGEPPTFVREGAQLAVEQINAAGGLQGKPLRLKFFDTRGDDQRNADLSRQISADPSYNALVGSYFSGDALDTLVTTHAKNLFYVIIGAELPSLTGYTFKNAVRPHFTTRDYTRALAELMRCQGHQYLAIIGDQSDYCVESAADLVKAFHDLGGVTTVVRTVPPWISDFREVLSEDTVASADVIFFSGSFQQLRPLLNQVKEFGIPAAFYGDSGALYSTTPQILGALGEGVEALTTFNPAAAGKNAEFVRSFVARYGLQPDLWARESYDGMMLLAESIRATGSLEAKTLFAHIHFQPGWDLAKGPVSFAPDGSLEGVKFYRMQIRNGMFVYPDGTATIHACQSQPPP